MEKHKKILIAIFIVTLILRLYFAFQTPNYDPDAYFHIRQVNEISATFTPLYNDPLSYGGRTLLFSPLFYYILAFFNMFLPSVIIFKIIPNLFASSLVFIVFFISKRLTNNNNLSLIAAGASSFIPVFISETINSLSIYSLVIPLMFLMIYFIMDIENKKTTVLYIISAFFISLIHPISVLLVICLLIYMILVRLERLKQTRGESELILFTILLIIWTQFLIFKNAILTHRLSIIWKNIPKEIVPFYFGRVNILMAIASIGLIPLVAGVYVIYKYLFREKNKEIYLLMSFSLAITLLLWLKLIQLTIGLAFLGIVFILLFAKYSQLFMEFIKKTKFPYLKYVFILFIILFFITSITPSYYFTKERIQNAPSEQEIEAFEWLKENSPKNATVLGTLEQGHLITAVADRRNVIDSNFLLIKNPSQILRDIGRIYSTQYETEAVEFLTKYKVNYIIYSKKARKEYKIPPELAYAADTKCFDLIYDKSAFKIYEAKCRLEKIS